MSNFSRHQWNAFNQWVLKFDVTISCLYSVFLQYDTMTIDVYCVYKSLHH